MYTDQRKSQCNCGKNYYVILEDTRKVVINVSEALLQTLSTLINEDYNQLHLIKQYTTLSMGVPV